MNQGQKKFFDFFIGRTKDGKIEDAETLLKESFARQAEGTLDKAYLDEIMPRYFELIKPEAIEELKEAMKSFSSKL